MKEFEQVIGYEDVKREFEYVLDIMLNNEKYSKLGVKTPHGILLNGNPGVGKTLMASCFKGETGMDLMKRIFFFSLVK